MDNNFNDPKAAATATPAPTPKPSIMPPKEQARAKAQTRTERPAIHNPNTAVSGVPRTVGLGQRQNDGTRSPVMSPPVKKGGLATRGVSPAKSTSDRVSGLESAMHAEADRHHPPRKRPRR